MKVPKEKHYIGFGLFFILLVFFYSFSQIVFNIVNESSVLIELIFLAMYLCILMALSIFYFRNNLIAESVVLFVFSILFANPLIGGLLYYPVFIAFDGTSTMEILDNYLYIFTYPFDIFYSNAVYVMDFASIIPFVFLVKMIVNRKQKNK